MSLYGNPFLQENLRKAGEYGIHIIEPRWEEGKAKIPKVDTLAAKVCHTLSSGHIKGKKILITGGPTPGKIDDIRILTNRFKGSLAVNIAKEAYLQGANPTLLLGKTGVRVPAYLETIYHEDYDQYVENVFNTLENGYDVGIFAAAVADYLPEVYTNGKIASDILTSIPLKKTKKVIEQVRTSFPELYMATFKYEDGVSHEELLNISRQQLEKGYDLVVANRAQEMQGAHQAYLLSKAGEISQPQSKAEIARALVDTIGSELYTRKDPIVLGSV